MFSANTTLLLQCLERILVISCLCKLVFSFVVFKDEVLYI